LTPEAPAARDIHLPPPALNDNALNIAIVFDRSSAMNASFGEGTKFDAAKGTLAGILELQSRNDNFAWQEVGGPCGDAASNEYWLPFGPGKERLVQRVRALPAPSGESSLVRAVVEATSSFNQLRQLQNRKSTIVVISGGYDQCRHADPAAAIKERLASYPEVVVDLRFIGVGLPPGAQSEFRALAKATQGRFTNAQDTTQLRSALQHYLVVEPKISDVQTALAVLNQSTEHVAQAVNAVTRSDHAAADEHLRQAFDTFQRTVIPLPEPRHPDDVTQLLNLAGEGRNEQQKVIDAVRALISAARSNDASDDARKAYNAASMAYRKHTEAINQLQTRMLAQ
jgi:hypothetical protein